MATRDQRYNLAVQALKEASIAIRENRVHTACARTGDALFHLDALHKMEDGYPIPGDTPIPLHADMK